MKPALSEWTIVLAGNWNVSILNPDWVARHVLQIAEVEVEMVLANMRPNLRYSTPDIVFMPDEARVVLSSKAATAEGVTGIERIATRLLNLLPVTPINACGINFGYRQTEPDAQLASLFNIGDTVRITNYPLIINSTAITRSMTYQDRTLNFRLAQLEDGAISFHLNYHKDVASAADAVAALQNINALREHGQELLKAIYAVELQGENA